MPCSAATSCEIAARLCEQIVFACWCVMAAALAAALVCSLGRTRSPRA